MQNGASVEGSVTDRLHFLRWVHAFRRSCIRIPNSNNSQVGRAKSSCDTTSGRGEQHTGDEAANNDVGPLLAICLPWRVRTMPAKMWPPVSQRRCQRRGTFSHEIQILIDIRHHLHAFRLTATAEHQREDQKVAEGHAGVEEHHAGKQQGKAKRFSLRYSRRHESHVDAVKRNTNKDRGVNGQLEGR